MGAALLGTAAGTTARAGVTYTMSNKAQKTFAAPADRVKTSLLLALQELDFPVDTDEKTDDGVRIVASANGREVEVELEEVTPRATRLHVVVRHGVFVKDRATAERIVEQTARGVETPALAAWAVSEADPSPRSPRFSLLPWQTLRLQGEFLAVFPAERWDARRERWRVSVGDPEGAGPDADRGPLDPDFWLTVERDIRAGGLRLGRPGALRPTLWGRPPLGPP